MRALSTERLRSALALLAGAFLLVGCADVRRPAPDFPIADGVARDVPVDSTTAATLEPVSFENTDEDEFADEHDHDHDHEEDDGEESIDIMECLDRGPGMPSHCPRYTWKSPLEGLSGAEIEKRVKTDLASIGPISLGPPNRGRLFNGVRMPESDKWEFTDPGNAYGTQETVDSIARAIEKVFAKHPDTHKVIIGHLSSKKGGWLKPHKSHQSGRDVDLSYFYTGKVHWYAYATEKNLDKARTWTFVKAFLEDPNTEMVLVDTSIQRLLYAHALAEGEDKDFLDKAFQISGKNPRAIIRHVKGHATHIHVRFFSPSAQASGRLAEAYLPKPAPPPQRTKGKHVAKGTDVADSKGDKAKTASKKGSKGEESFVYHRARSGDTLDSLSRRYGVSVQEIKQANGLKSNAIKEKKTYRIPKRGPVASTASKGGSRSKK